MATEAEYLAELKATERPILRQHCLQRACNDLPPDALTRLYMQLPALGGRAVCRVAPGYKYMVGAARQRAAKRPGLQKQPDFGAHAKYGTPDVAAKNKTLYIMFSGQDGQFFLPLSVVLHLLPDGPKDVLVIRSGLEQYFVGGVQGLGVTPFEVANGLLKTCAVETYQRVVVLGISAGGVFAMRVAEFLAADIAISFAAVHADEGYRVGMADDASVAAFDPLCACRPQKIGRMINVFGSRNEFDLLCSLRMKRARPSLMEMHVVNSGNHNVLLPMLEGHYARLFFRAALARNGALIWLMASLSRAYGLYIVRGYRRLAGRQKVDDWYMADKAENPAAEK